MDKFKGKYEIILGFVTLVVSLSAFKEELSKIYIDLGFTTITFSQYFLYSVVGFSLCLYLYIIEFTVRETRIGHWKIFDNLILLAYAIFVFILLSPLLIGLNVFVVSSYNYAIEKPNEQRERIIIIILQVINFVFVVGSLLEGQKIFKKRRETIMEEVETNQILEIETAEKLYKDAYYSQAILEIFKAFESYLQREVLEKNHRAPKPIYELLSVSQKLGIINGEDQANIKNLLKLRMAAAHKTEIILTRSDAESAIDFVKRITSKDFGK